MKKNFRIILLLLAAAVILCACAQTELPAETPEQTPAREEPATVVIEATPEPTASPEPVQTPESDEQRDVYLVAIEGTAYRSAPGAEGGNFLGTLSTGTRLLRVEERGEDMLVALPSGEQVWVNAWYLDPEDEGLARERAQTRFETLTGRDSFVAIEGEPQYSCIASLLNCRAEPSLTGTVLYQIVTGTKVTVYGRDGAFYLCRLPNGRLCYCSSDWLSDGATYVVYPGAVDLRVFLPGAEFDLLFASSNNITGHAMYAAIPLLEEGVAYKLLEAYQKFREDGYTIKIYDAYRPRSAQVELFNIVRDARYIADPSHGGSWHQRGWAVDMSLIDLSTGEELEMPTPMHTFSAEAGRGKRNEWSEEVRKNVDYMTQVMTSVGFGTIGTEWWHFEYTRSGKALDPDIDLESLPSYPVSSYTPPY